MILVGKLSLLVAAFILPIGLLGQTIPASATANLYFPHFVVGGNAEDYWVTSFDFANPNDRPVQIWLYGNSDAGEALSINLAGVSRTEHIIDIPANGSAKITSPRAPQSIVSGWVEAYATMPVQGIATYTRIRNGVTIANITAEASQQTIAYTNIANQNLGIALANKNNFGINLFVLAVSENGAVVGEHSVHIPRWGHTAFNLYSIFPHLPENFLGTVFIGTDTSTTYFLAWSLIDDGSGVSSALPTGHLRRPVHQYDRIWNVYTSLVDAFDRLIGGPLPLLIVNDDVSMAPNAFAHRVGGVEVIEITYALGELLADSTDELAFVVGHEMAHIAQFRTQSNFWDQNPERDADILGTILAINAGYDPYAMAGALAKLSMASGIAGLITQWEARRDDIHGSFNDRLATVYQTLVGLCSLPSVSQTCRNYRDIYHPHVPGAPLSRGGDSNTSFRTSRVPGVARGAIQMDRSRDRTRQLVR